MFMSAMVRIFSFGERWNVLFNEAIAELNRTFHLSPNENILTIARIKTFIICLYNTKINYCFSQNCLSNNLYHNFLNTYGKRRIFFFFFVFSASEFSISPEMSFFFHQNKYMQAPAILSFFLKSSACIKSHLPHVENRV